MSREQEDLQGYIERAVRKFLGEDDSGLVATALNCIGKGYDRRKTEKKIGKILEDRDAVKFTDKLYGAYEDYQSSLKRDKSRKRKEEQPFEENGTEVKKTRKEVVEPVAEEVHTQPSPGQLTQEKISAMMLEAQKMIMERKIQMNFSAPAPPAPPPSSAPPPPRLPLALPKPPQPLGPVPSQDAVEKAKKAMELQASIQARLGNLIPSAKPPVLEPGAGLVAMGFTPAPPPKQSQPSAGPTPLILDEEGRTIDASTGEAVQLEFYKPSLKANIRAKRREQFKKELQERPPEEITESRFFDDRLGNRAAGRNKRGFKFHDKGKFEQLAVNMRTKAQLDRLQNEITQAAKRTGIASAAKLATIQPKTAMAEDEVPDVEWWDSVILRNGSFSSLDEAVPEGKEKFEGITHLVEHPIQLKPPAESNSVPAIPVMLTAKERKKLRRQRRMEVQKEIQEKVRLGLMPPPEPKVRLANLMRVLGQEAVQDPTKIEAHVRAQMAKRLKDHEERNKERKLSKDEKKAKKAKKLKEDTSLGVQVVVYRVTDLSNPAKKFKVETNANQLYMTGAVVLHKDCNVVVVEGGPKQQKKFRRLMMHRIKWNEDRKAKDEDDEDEEEEKVNKCVLVWEGQVKTRAFGEMKFKLCPTETFAREQFRKAGVEQYWDLAFSGSVLESAERDIS